MLFARFSVLCSFKSSEIAVAVATCLGLSFLSSQNRCDSRMYCSWYKVKEPISYHHGSKEAQRQFMCICCQVSEHTKINHMFVSYQNMSYDISAQQNRKQKNPMCSSGGSPKLPRQPPMSLTCSAFESSSNLTNSTPCSSFPVWIKDRYLSPRLEIAQDAYDGRAGVHINVICRVKRHVSSTYVLPEYHQESGWSIPCVSLNVFLKVVAIIRMVAARLPGHQTKSIRFRAMGFVESPALVQISPARIFQNCMAGNPCAFLCALWHLSADHLNITEL